MHALIRQGNGKYYVSAVFGYYKDIKSEDDYQRYLESIHSPYYVVLNPEKTALIKVFAMQPNTKYLIPLVLIIETDHAEWITDEEGVGGVDFLPREKADAYTMPELLSKRSLMMANCIWCLMEHGDVPSRCGSGEMCRTAQKAGIRSFMTLIGSDQRSFCRTDLFISWMMTI